MSNIRNFCIIAHIDHGKSTLADRLLELTGTIEARFMKAQVLDQMDLERERGITIKLQPVRMIYHSQTLNPKSKILNKSKIQNSNNPNSLGFSASNLEIADSKFILNLIDTPGHVDFSYEVSRSLAAVEGAILLVDATQGIQAQTLANYYQAQKQNLTIIPVINKIDMPNADIKKVGLEIANLLKIGEESILKVSAKTGENVPEVLRRVIELVPEPKGELEKPLRALVFDSVYDSYRGVVAYIRVVDGKIQKGDKIKLLATGVDDEALEVGYFKPKFAPSDSLMAGEIGYIVTGLKDVSQCGVGDTITSKTENCKLKIVNYDVIPLPGYKNPQPMVYASVYSADGEVNKLREAIAKLKLNDASLNYEPENSRAFGFGFRCGFLGLLHLEIFKERLEREYDLDLLITTPQVAYKKKMVGSKTSYEEPWVSLEIVTPQEYIGSVMDYLNHIRGIYLKTEYLRERVILTYQAPLASIVINFYDKLKSLTSGYGSLNYQFIGYREENLVKMDILVAGENIDVLEQIVHHSQVKPTAKSIVSKLMDLIPRQMFEVSIQAAVGGTILARENIPAMKKDVTGYLYGGDITRKKKLWAKQARGKKKMKKMGRVEIPTDVFIKLLKQ